MNRQGMEKGHEGDETSNPTASEKHTLNNDGDDNNDVEGDDDEWQ